MSVNNNNQAAPLHINEGTSTASYTATASSAQHSNMRQGFRGKRSFPKSNSPKDKRPRNSDFERRDLAPSLSMVPCKRFYSVYAGSEYLPDITDRVYQALHARIKTVPDVIDIHLFRYVVSLAFYARLVAVNMHYGAAITLGSSELKKATTGLQFPVVICQYIEALGLVKMQNGTSIIPYVDDYRKMIPIGSEYYFDPLQALQDARRPEPDNEWSIDLKWIAHYNTVAHPKLQRSGIELRSILQETCEGKAELLISFKELEDQVIPLSPEKQTLSVAHRGAAFRYRKWSPEESLPSGENWLLTPQFTCETISPDNVLANLISDSLKTSI